MTRIKVCGLKTREMFEHAVREGADYVGFVFTPSKRQVSAEQSAQIAEGGRVSTQRVGVFVNETREELLRIADVAGLDVLQLHGDESPEFCRELKESSGREVWKAWGVTGDERDECLAGYRGAVDAVLLDNARGGTGERFSWERIPYLRGLLPEVRLFVAGGLHPDNVEELVKTYRPDGVDVSSGVETDGAKDPIKITDFVTRARDAR
jgi:phosphoribosylanthranilate isomerase